MDTEIKVPWWRKKFGIGLIGIVFIAVVCLAVYFWNDARQLRKNPGDIQAQEVADTVRKVSQLILLPEGETPTLGTVSDPEKLKDQPFFANAKIGYKVLIYTKAQKAILYDPERHLIIEVAPIKIGAEDLE